VELTCKHTADFLLVIAWFMPHPPGPSWGSTWTSSRSRNVHLSAVVLISTSLCRCSVHWHAIFPCTCSQQLISRISFWQLCRQYKMAAVRRVQNSAIYFLCLKEMLLHLISVVIQCIEESDTICPRSDHFRVPSLRLYILLSFISFMICQFILSSVSTVTWNSIFLYLREVFSGNEMSNSVMSTILFCLLCINRALAADGTHQTSQPPLTSLVPPWRQGFCTDIEEIGVMCLWLRGDSLLHVSVCFKPLAA
jgi:hypothetical protein